jgi:hypothetical protein
VRLHASQEDIASLLDPQVRENEFEMVEANFLAQGEVLLLKNGEALTTSLGAVSGDSSNEPWLRYGAEIEISVRYQDLEGRKYQSKLPLKVYAREGFGGGMWRS